MFLFVRFVLFACVGMRAASRILETVFSFLEIDVPVPSWHAGRLWLLRIGLYKLEREKQISDDWIWIIDHTVQLGKEKCLVILGIRQTSLPKGELYLTREDVEPIALIPVEQSNGEIVFDQLEKTVPKTGVPRQIVSDHGTDLKSGIEKFCRKHGAVHTYDMKHKGAAILKREMNDDPDWQEFASLASKTGKKLQQTDLAALAPPNRRSKARYMNVDKLVDWGSGKLLYLDREKEKDPDNFKDGVLFRKLGWLFEFRQNIKEWKVLVSMVKAANEYVNFMGLEKGVHEGLKAELQEIEGAESFPGVSDELVSFVREHEEKTEGRGRLLGSSEIIESAIGKYKGLQGEQVKGGFTGMLLGLAASVSDFSRETVEKAIACVSTKKVWNWISENVGKSVFSKRKEINKIVKELEQKRDENTSRCLA